MQNTEGFARRPPGFDLGTTCENVSPPVEYSSHGANFLPVRYTVERGVGGAENEMKFAGARREMANGPVWCASMGAPAASSADSTQAGSIGAVGSCTGDGCDQPVVSSIH